MNILNINTHLIADDHRWETQSSFVVMLRDTSLITASSSALPAVVTLVSWIIKGDEVCACMCACMCVCV